MYVERVKRRSKYLVMAVMLCVIVNQPASHIRLFCTGLYCQSGGLGYGSSTAPLLNAIYKWSGDVFWCTTNRHHWVCDIKHVTTKFLAYGVCTAYIILEPYLSPCTSPVCIFQPQASQLYRTQTHKDKAPGK